MIKNKTKKINRKEIIKMSRNKNKTWNPIKMCLKTNRYSN